MQPAAIAADEPALRPLRVGLGAALAALVCAAFAPALTAEFLDFDDDKLFTLNHQWRGLGADHLRWMSSTTMMGHYQPLTWLSFAVDHAVHGLSGPDHPQAWAYHATSLVLHALVAVVFLALAERILRIAMPRVDARLALLAAALAAALWAVHPLRVESVVWLTERRDLLSGLFFLLALRAWLGWATRGDVPVRPARGDAAVATLALASVLALGSAIAFVEPSGLAIASPALLVVGIGAWMAAVALLAGGSPRGPALVVAHVCLLLSLLCKAWGMVLPALLVVLDVWPLRRWSGARLRTLAVEKLPLLVLALVFARFAFWAQATTIGVMKSWADHPLGARLAQAAYGLLYYPVKTVAPVHLLPLRPLPKTMSLADPAWLVPVLVVLAIAVAVLAVRRRVPALCAAAAAYAAILAPVLGFSQSGPQLVADRYAYLAGMPLVLLAAGAVPRLATRWPEAVATVAVALVIASSAATWRQATFWRTSTALWERAYSLDPDNAGTLVSLGNLRSKEAQAQNNPRRGMALLVEALDLHRRAFALDENPLMLCNLSQVETLMSLYDPERAREHHLQALAYAEQTIELARKQDVMGPEYVLTYGTALVNVGRVEEGIAQLEEFVRQQPDRLMGLVNLAGALTIAGRPGQAVAHLERASRLEPRDIRPWLGLGRAHEKLGRKPEALAAWQRVLALSPTDSVAAAHARALAMELHAP